MYQIKFKKGLNDSDRRLFTELRKNYKYYPYLYHMVKEYEDEYQDCYQNIGDKLDLFMMYDADKLVAISTCTAFDKRLDIVSDFYNWDLNLEGAYYFGDIVVNKRFQGKGVAKKLYEKSIDHAKNKGYTKIYALIVNLNDDPRRPTNFNYSQLWSELGFNKTRFSISYDWPTYQLDGSVKMESNNLCVFIKNLG